MYILIVNLHFYILNNNRMQLTMFYIISFSAVSINLVNMTLTP